MYKVLRSTKFADRFSLKHSKKYLLENRFQESLIVLWVSYGGANRQVSYSMIFCFWCRLGLSRKTIPFSKS